MESYIGPVLGEPMRAAVSVATYLQVKERSSNASEFTAIPLGPNTEVRMTAILKAFPYSLHV